MARLSQEHMRSAAYVGKLITEAEEILTRAQNGAFEALANTSGEAKPEEFQALVLQASGVRDKADTLSRMLAALAVQLQRIADLQALLSADCNPKSPAKPSGKKAAAASAE